jgi:hypothetical protein
MAFFYACNSRNKNEKRGGTRWNPEVYAALILTGGTEVARRKESQYFSGFHFAALKMM